MDNTQESAHIWEEFSGRLRSHLLKKIRNKGDVDDLMQDIPGDPCITATCNCTPPRAISIRQSVLVKAENDETAVNRLVAAPQAVPGPPIDIVTGAPVVPDVRGLSAREAILKLARLGLAPRVTGDGTVVDQDPAPGMPLVPNSTCRLWLDRIMVPPTAHVPHP
jgi:hypothetical protein